VTTLITIPGSQGSTLTFTVSGGAAANYANDFSRDVQFPTAITTLSTNGGAGAPTIAGALNIIGPSNTSTFSIPGTHQYTYAAVSAPTRLVGSAGGADTVLAGGGVSYVANGGQNKIIFSQGNNIFFGNAAGGNTITGGAGYDTINAGTGSATVFSGAGHSLVNLGDTVGGDIAALLAGSTTVNAFGHNDTVYASAASMPTSAQIFGGAGTLSFAAGPSESTLNVTIVGGSGTTEMFGAAGTDMVFANKSGTAAFTAGAGNETLNAANAAGNFAFFGDTNTADALSIDDTIVGGNGNEYFSTGGGHETIFAGTGGEMFQINDVGAGTTITIVDFSASDSVNFAGLTVSEETSLLGTASTLSGGNLSVTLTDGTKVDFIGISSLAGHLK